MGYIVSPHAAFEMQRRGLTEAMIAAILSHPQQRLTVRRGRDVFQSKLVADGKEYLVRIFVDVDRKPAEVVTVYRTSKIRKYWRQEL